MSTAWKCHLCKSQTWDSVPTFSWQAIVYTKGMFCLAWDGIPPPPPRANWPYAVPYIKSHLASLITKQKLSWICKDTACPSQLALTFSNFVGALREHFVGALREHFLFSYKLLVLVTGVFLCENRFKNYQNGKINLNKFKMLWLSAVTKTEHRTAVSLNPRCPGPRSALFGGTQPPN